jgi:hypothetical protein
VGETDPVKRLALYATAVVLVRLPAFVFKRRIRQAAVAVDMDRLARLRRSRALVTLAAWTWMGLWLYLLPDYDFAHWKNRLAWMVVLGAFGYGLFELWRSGSKLANARYALRLLSPND